MDRTQTFLIVAAAIAMVSALLMITPPPQPPSPTEPPATQPADAPTAPGQSQPAGEWVAPEIPLEMKISSVAVAVGHLICGLLAPLRPTTFARASMVVFLLGQAHRATLGGAWIASGLVWGLPVLVCLLIANRSANAR